MIDETPPTTERHLRVVDPPDDERDEIPLRGREVVHPETKPEDLARARAAALLEAARTDLIGGQLHPNAVRRRLEEELAPLEGHQRSKPLSPGDVLASWRSKGPVVHEPTGLATLDDATGGGPVYGTRWFVMGAPNAGKTALMVQIAHDWALDGIAVGVLAVDEEPDDMTTRLAQRIGFERAACEARQEGAIARMQQHIGHLPLRFYDEDWTIEAAAADLAEYAKQRRTRAAFFVDSLQTVTCDAMLERELSTPQAIDRCAKAVRRVAKEHGLIALATSEMARAAYRSKQSREEIDPMAAGKWSGAIEYQAKVLIALRSVSGSKTVIEAELPKNKHEDEDSAAKFYLSINRASQKIEECEPPPKKERASKEDEADERANAHQMKVESMGRKLLEELNRRNAKGIRITGQRELLTIVKGDTNLKKEAISWLAGEGLIQGGRGKPYERRYQASNEEGP